MTSIVNDPNRPALPVTVDFYFEQAGPLGSATYDGDTYPYPPLPSDKGSDYRYAWGTTPVFLAVEFHAEPFEVESKVQPHVQPPPGVTILEYRWDFGDGHVGHGPTVTHTYEVADPDTEISLTVLDSLGREWSTSKTLSLVFVDFGYTYPRIRGVNTETPPKRKEAEASGDFALTVEGTPTRVWIARAGEPIREEEEKALSADRATILTHFFRSTTDTSLSDDVPIRTRNMVRHATDPNRSLVRAPSLPVEVVSEGQSRQRLLATIGPAMPYPEPSPFYEVDKATRITHRFAHATEMSVSSDARPTWHYRRLIEALLGLLGKSPH
jgi:hypothetical protein